MNTGPLDCCITKFLRRISVVGFAVIAGSLATAPNALASYVPIMVDDILIMAPCADFSGNAGIAGASITVAGKTVLSDGSGNYLIRCVQPGSYSVSPSRTGYTFNPTATPVVVARGSHATFVNNFVASATPIAGSASMTWESPNQHVAGNCLTASLSSYRVHRGVSAGNYTAVETILVNNPALACVSSGIVNACTTVPILTCTYTATNLPSGAWYFAVQAVDSNNEVSGYSNEVRKTVP